MEKDQELEWGEAQKIDFSCGDLVDAARRQLVFLAAVDKRRSLYDDGPVLQRAIHRYMHLWLPLLYKYSESSSILMGSLVVPLDCEWIWHCHRLNPIQYKKDCECLYGKILSSQDVKSTSTTCDMHATVELWDKLYEDEPFELNHDLENLDKFPLCPKTFDYDLVSAVKRQNSFYYQVSRPTSHDGRFLEGAVSRYKGFLHLIKRNQEKSLKRFCVPTYDVDIMWHSHQLQPVAYCKDTFRILGRVLGHDDTDSDRSNGSKLDVGFSETTKQWEESYGLRYWRSGAMYRGNSPSPVTVKPLLNHADGTVVSTDPCLENFKDPTQMVTEDIPRISKRPRKYLSDTRLYGRFTLVLLEVVNTKNAPAHQKGSLFISFRKQQPDNYMNDNYTLNIQSETGQRQIAGFECEPTGQLKLDLMSRPISSKSVVPRKAKTIGTVSISLEDLMKPESELVIEKWFQLELKSGNGESKIYLHVAVSFTVPVAASRVLYMVKSLPFLGNICFFPFPRKVQSWSHFIDENNNELSNIRMRFLKKQFHSKSISKQVLSTEKGSGKTRVLAELTGKVWSLVESKFSFSLENKNSQEDDHVFEFIGEPLMKLFQGRRLDFEPKTCKCKEHLKDKHHFFTVVKFTTEDPYGKALALINLKSGLLKVNEEWFVLSGKVLAYILSDMRKKGRDNIFIPHNEVVEKL